MSSPKWKLIRGDRLCCFQVCNYALLKLKITFYVTQKKHSNLNNWERLVSYCLVEHSFMEKQNIVSLNEWMNEYIAWILFFLRSGLIFSGQLLLLLFTAFLQYTFQKSRTPIMKTRQIPSLVQSWNTLSRNSFCKTQGRQGLNRHCKHWFLKLMRSLCSGIRQGILFVKETIMINYNVKHSKTSIHGSCGRDSMKICDQKKIKTKSMLSLIIFSLFRFVYLKFCHVSFGRLGVWGCNNCKAGVWILLE